MEVSCVDILSMCIYFLRTCLAAPGLSCGNQDQVPHDQVLNLGACIKERRVLAIWIMRDFPQYPLWKCISA